MQLNTMVQINTDERLVILCLVSKTAFLARVSTKKPIAFNKWKSSEMPQL